MDTGFLLRGLLMGFAIAAPVGPIGLLCIRRTLTEGRVVGLVSGLGAASADALYGVVAAFGLTFASSLLIDGGFWMRLVGGLFLAYLGLTTMRAAPPERAASVSGVGLLAAYTSTFILTLSNPATILSFATIFAGVGLVSGAGYGAAALMVLGVFLGSALWWLLLSGGVGLLRSRITTTGLRWVNRVAGALILAFALGLLWSLRLA